MFANHSVCRCMRQFYNCAERPYSVDSARSLGRPLSTASQPWDYGCNFDFSLVHRYKLYWCADRDVKSKIINVVVLVD